MTSTGHLPKFADDAYHIERDDLWLIPTAEVPLTSMHRGEILEESQLPLRYTASTACYRREAGSAGRDTRGLLRVHEFDKVELFAYATPEGALDAQADILERAESMLQDLELPYRVLDLCTGDLGGSSARTFDLEAFAPGVDRWLEVSSVSWFRDYQARRANVRYRPADGGPPQLVHTVNGSALAWPRIWAALVENGRQEDGTVMLPEALAPYLGGRAVAQGTVSDEHASPGGAGSGDDASFGFAPMIDTIATESRRLATVVGASDLESLVPSCPEWSVRDLAHHIGVVQWYWGENVRAKNADERSGGELTPTPEDADLLAWLGWCTYSLLERVARARAPARRAGPGGPRRAPRAPSAGTRPRRPRCTGGTPRGWAAPPVRCRPSSRPTASPSSWRS